MNKNNKEFKSIILINVLRDIIEIFSGPFLTAYFIKTSIESMISLSTFNIFSYTILLLFSIIVGFIIKNKLKIFTFRVGILLNFAYILSFILLKNKIIDYLWLVSILYGLSTSFYYMPFNFFLTKKIKNSDRSKFEVRKKTLSNFTNILIPIFLGSMITLTNYSFTAIIILIISFIQIILSFILEPIPNTKEKFNLIKTIKNIQQNKSLKRILLLTYISGFTLSSGALITINTILVYNAFNSDFNLGILTSIVSILQIIFAILYKKYFENKNEKKLILFLSIIPNLSLILFILFNSNTTIVIYYLCYNVLINLLSMIHTIKLFNILNIDVLIKDQIEFLSIREVFLNLGRISGFLLLLLIGLTNNIFLLNIVMILLALSLIIFSNILNKLNK